MRAVAHGRVARLPREAQVRIAIRWFIGYRLEDRLPDHSSLTRIWQCWGETRFWEIFRHTVRACLESKVVKGEVVYVDASLIRADLSWESLVERHVDEVMAKRRIPAGCSWKPRRFLGSIAPYMTEPFTTNDGALFGNRRSKTSKDRVKAYRGSKTLPDEVAQVIGLIRERRPRSTRYRPTALLRPLPRPEGYP